MQTWNNHVALHHPGNFFYTTTFNKFKIGYMNFKIIAQLKKRLCDFSKTKPRYIKLKIIAQLKTKGFESFHTSYKHFLHQYKEKFTTTFKKFTPTKKNLHHPGLHGLPFIPCLWLGILINSEHLTRWSDDISLLNQE